MGTLHTLRPRPAASAFSSADMRAQLEEAAQSALDTADALIAILDVMEGNTDREDSGDVEPSLGSPENHASQIVWLRDSDTDHETLDRQDSGR